MDAFTGQVVPFRPNNGQDLDNVPHMLRYWAAEIEAGRLEGHQVIAVMLPADEQMKGHPFQIGPEMNPATLIGHLFAVCGMVGNYRLNE